MLRRLKLATSTGRTTGILFRAKQASQSPSPANVRFTLSQVASGLEMHLIKIQGRREAKLLLDLKARAEYLP